ncbi:MAG: PEP-CTERM sorting domain-containing protein [Phycisphaerales bacterium]
MEGNMRVRNITMMCIAGLASSAAAQSASLSIVASQSVVDSTVTNIVTLQIFGDADFGTHITGAAFMINASDSPCMIIDSIELNSVAQWGALGQDDFGDAGDGSHNGVIMGQITFLPFIQPDAASALGNGPVLLATMVVTISPLSAGQMTWTLGGGIGEFALEVIDVNGNPNGNPPGEITRIVNPDFGSATVLSGLVPAPSSGALLGLGALVAGRRRR